MTRNLKRRIISSITSLAMVFSFGATNALDAYNGDTSEPQSVKLNYESIEELPDGGKIYTYIINGQEHKFPVPPDGFKPIDATDEQLDTYGFPPRPDKDNSEDEYTDWLELMSHYKSTPIPEVEQIIGNDVSADEGINTLSNENKSFATVNGAGYAASLYNTGNFFSQVQGDFVQPAIVETSGVCGNTFMVGFGALQGSSSAAAGTLVGVGSSQAYAFYECFYDHYLEGKKDSVRLTSVPVNPGDKVHVYVAYQKSNNKFNYYIVNTTTGKYASSVVTYDDASYFSGEYASWFVGRPKTINNIPCNFGNFRYAYFSNCKAMVNTSTNWTDLGNFNRVLKVQMTAGEGGSALTDIGSILNNNQFYCTWKSYY